MNKPKLFRTALHLLAILTILAGLVGSLAVPQRNAAAAANLTVQIIAAPNLVVDSNALSPSTYAPKVATVIGKFCNTGDATASNVTAYIGDYTGSGTLKGTPGTYPSKTDVTIGAQFYSGTYAFEHLGGSADAARFLGDLAAGECRYQFWSFEYPHLANGGSIPTWGSSVKPTDDLSLDFDMWIQDGSGTLSANATHTATMRNEISAMANKIKPNGNPAGQWFNTDTSTVYPGQTITTNGVYYRLGNINQGFDNNLDGVPDYNAWLQPFGDPAYDPSCFRLVGVTGVLTVTRSGGNPDLIIPIDNNLYFTDLPADNTDVRGLVYYEFLALDGACTIPISPYQEVASGSDNEKFNGDYGTGVPALLTYEPEVILDKTGNATVAESGIITYNLPFYNNSTTAKAGLTLSSGGVYAPLTLQDTIPEGLEYVCNTAAISLDYGGTATIYYATDGGNTWSTSQPASCPTNPVSTAANPIVIRWALNDPLPVKPGSGTNTSAGNATFQARVPTGYINGGNDPFIENCAQASFGDAAPFAQECATTLVEGTASIGDRVWQDENGDANQTGESSIADITVNLYWDKNGNGILDDDEPLLKTANTTSAAANYTFGNLPAGNYIVKVDSADPQLPTGYSATTPELYAVTLSTGQTYTTADFGFGPTLRVDKHLNTPNPAVVGETVTFHIDLINTRPGDGSPNGYCVYDIWASTASTGSPPKDFTAPNNAIGSPNLQYAVGNFSTGSNKELTGSGFYGSNRTSTITKVELLVPAYFDQYLSDDTLLVTVNGTTGPWSRSFSITELNAFAPNESQKGYLTDEIPTGSAPGGSWDWNDFASLAAVIAAAKTGGADSSQIYIDAIGFRVTTSDTSCATGDSTIATLPFTDTYNAADLQFLSAEPPVTDSSTPGILTWSNLGPLYAGGTKTISVSFKALQTVTGSINTATVQNAKFSSNRSVNDDSDTATVDVNASGSISGHIFADTNATGTWNNPTGYSTGDTFFAGVKVNLRACISNVTGIALPLANATNQPCTGSNNNSTWQTITTQYTDSSGAYTFSGLRNGYYNVVVDDTTLPTGFTTNSVETTFAGNGAGGSGGDDNWNNEAANLSTSNFNNIVNGVSGENITAVSFGYRDDGSNQGAVIGYVWHDVNANGQWLTSTENPLAGITVELCSDSNCSSVLQTTTTDSNGRYTFGNVTPGSVYVRVTPPNGMTQSGDPDTPNVPCGTCDNQTTAAVTVTANAVTNAGNFGYTGGYTLGDTIYTDWNADGTQNPGETGIQNVLVYLYRDTNGNGSIDSGEPLLDTATTNSSGFYQFTNLPGNGADYIVRVAASSLPSGYTLTGDPVGALDNHAAYELTNASIDAADFGYQPRGFGSIGDTIWNDANGNGVQDPTESGIANVLVNLYVWNDDGDNIYQTGELGAQVDAQTTNASGIYAFENLPAGKFLVQVDSANFSIAQPLANLTLSGDPDSTADNLHPVNLAAAQSYTTADFGYTASAIGDFIWQDNDGDGIWDSGEPGINGVIVDLYLDADNNGTADGAPIATATTANNSQGKPGYYLFGGLSANNYIVKVRASNFDPGGTLEGYSQTGAPNASSQPCSGSECDNTNWLKGITASDSTFFPGLQLGQNDLSSDFGYKPAGGIIGDTVWIDTDNNGTRDPSERGIAYITVKLCTDSACTSVSQTTTTDENGFYSFSGLANNTPYWVQVDTADTDFPAGLTATYDRDGTADSLINNIVLTSGNVSSVNGNACTNCDLEMDFGYRFSGSNSIGGTIWHDTDNGGQTNGIGDIDAGETVRYEGVPVYLWRCVSGCGGSDDILVSQTTSDSNGTYSFTNLANGDYRVVANPNAYSVKGMTTTTPTAYSDITLSDSTTAQRDFGFLSELDFGDLPNNTYNATLMADNGARHTISSLKLGTVIDNDADGQGTGASASGDDLDGTDDDDGVTINGNWENGANGGKLAITVSGCTGTCYLSGWLDWNSDGDFNDTKERILLDVPVTNNGGLPQSITFEVPAGTIDGVTSHAFFARFRLYAATTNGLAQPTGLVSGGEVEDYLWNFGPNAITLQTLQAVSPANNAAWFGIALLLLSLSAAVLLKRR